MTRSFRLPRNRPSSTFWTATSSTGAWVRWSELERSIELAIFAAKPKPSVPPAMASSVPERRRRSCVFRLPVHSQNIILSFLVTLSAMADSQKRRQVGQGHRGLLVFERVVHGRRAVQPLRLARVRDSDGRAKFVNAGGFRLG
jgi:hypothetical protein